ncbi:MAG: hypothetical protein N2513_02205 [Deltaproteobacteria bacterium]|nr:hypothetical protein [Deltaproteobacteria bacterium]
MLALLLGILVSKVHAGILEKVRYPVIALNLFVSLLAFGYPSFLKVQIADTVIEFIALSSFLMFLAFSNKKEGSILKECIPLVIVYLSSCVNLFFLGHLPLILPISIAGCLYLYVIMKTKQLICLSIMCVASILYMWVQDFKFFDLHPILGGRVKFTLIGASFLLFTISFLQFVRDKKQNPLVMLVFVGMLGIVFDVILSIGFSFRFGLFKVPYLASLIVILLSGFMMKKESELR